MQILSITIATIRNPKINKQPVAMKAPQPSEKASWVRHREHCCTWVGLAHSLRVVTFWIHQCCRQLTQHVNFAQWVSVLNRPWGQQFPATFSLIHQCHGVHLFLPSPPPPRMARRIWRWFLCQDTAVLCFSSKIKDKIKKRPNMWPFSI